jgi:hypothetical protein
MYRAVPVETKLCQENKNRIIDNFAYQLNFYVLDTEYVFHPMFDILLQDRNQLYE